VGGMTDGPSGGQLRASTDQHHHLLLFLAPLPRPNLGRRQLDFVPVISISLLLYREHIFILASRPLPSSSFLTCPGHRHPFVPAFSETPH